MRKNGKTPTNRPRRSQMYPWILIIIGSIAYGSPVGRKDASEMPAPPMTGKCSVVINEISLQDLDRQFIELTKVCGERSKSTRAINMQKYAVVFVNSEDYIIGTCLLKGEYNTKENWFYTIGTDTLENVDYKLNDCELMTGLSQNGRIRLPGDMKKFGVFGILLVRKERLAPFQNYKLVNLGFRKDMKKILPQTKGTLVTGLQDYYILANNVNRAFPPNLKSYYTKYDSGDILKSNPTVQASSTKLSFSRCSPQSNFSPLQPKLFLLSKPTPGKINDCSETSMATENSETGDGSVNERQSVLATIFPETSTADLDMDTELAIIRELMITGNGHTQLVTDQTLQPTSEDVSKFSYNVKAWDKFQLDFESDSSLFWDNCSTFPAEKIKAMQDLKYKPIDVQKVASMPFCLWVDYLVPQKKVRCKLCYTLLRQQLIFDRKGSIPEIITNGGGSFDVKTKERGYVAASQNYQMIVEHDKSALHQISLEFKNHFESGHRNQTLLDIFQGPGSLLRSYLQPTMNLIISVIQSIKIGMSFNSFTTLMETLNYFNADIGHLYRNPNGMKVIADSIGIKLHQDIIRRLITEEPEMSITLDTSTDVSGYGLLAVLFHTIESTGDKKIYLYRVMHIPQGESGYDLFRQFKQSLQADGIDDYVRRKCTALTTDGAPAVRTKFRELLNGFIENELVGVWCGAHKLERAAKKAFAEHEFLRDIDEFVNSVFRMLSSKSTLRREEFRAQFENFGYRPYEYHRLREIRWLSHHERALVPFIKRFNVLAATLYSIITNPKIPLETRQEAEILLNRLKDPTFIATLAFAADAIQIIADLSVEYQRHAGTLIGKKLLRTETEERLKSLENNAGEYMSFVLENSMLNINGQNFSINDIPDLTLRERIEKFETSLPEFLDTKLNNANSLYNQYRVHTNMQKYIDSLLTQLDGYYAPDVTDCYDIFAPKLLPSEKDKIPGYGKSELLRLNMKFKWGINERDMISEWEQLLTSILDSGDFQENRVKYPEEFWNLYLKRETISWNTNIRNILMKALTIAAGSGDCERVFSLYTYVKSYRRYSLLPATVENLIRIKVNGKVALKDWDVVEFAKAFILDSHSRADDVTRGKSVKEVCDAENIATEDIEICPATDEEYREKDPNFNLITTD